MSKEGRDIEQLSADFACRREGEEFELSSVMNHESRNQKCPCPGGRGSRQESFPSEETWDKSILESSPVKLCYKATPLGAL